MKGYPNTYALSKLMAEDLAHSFRHKFPIIITRPSLVTPAWQEPYPGYVESKKNGLMGTLTTRGRGVMRTMLANPDANFELIPVDIANNAIIVLTRNRALTPGNEILYSNLTNSGSQSWTIGQYYDFEMEVIRKYPLDLLLWYPYCPVTKHRWYYEYRRLFYHYWPALVADFWCILFRRKPK
jgi:alcohol-forming fatty acyl-CoA reductase